MNQDGSGAGMAAVCSGQVDIGEASTFYGTGAQPATTPDATETSYGCPETIAVEVIAYDGVDAITQTANPHGLQSISWDTLQAIFVAANTGTVALSGTNLNSAGHFTMGNGAASQTATPAAVATPTFAGSTPGFAWDQIPACAGAATTCAGSAVANGVDTNAAPLVAYSAIPATESAANFGAAFTNDLCSAAVGDATTCGWTIFAGGATAAAQEAQIDLPVRSDVSGTTQSFIGRDLVVGASGGTPAGIGFTGCCGDNQFDGCNIAYTSSYGHDGNPAVIQAVAGDPNAIGYASDGLAQSPSSGVIPVNLQGYGRTLVVNMQGESVALKAIAKGISDHETGASTYATDQAYVGWRPFLNVETAPPTGEVLRYLQWVMDPANNEAVAAATYEISVYASGLAGVVPITPIP